MAGRFFGARRSDPWGRRRSTRKGGVLIGLLPVYAIGGLVLFQSMTGGSDGTLYAGSAVAADDTAGMTTMDRPVLSVRPPLPRPAMLMADRNAVEEGAVGTTVRSEPVPPVRPDAPPGWRVAPVPEVRPVERPEPDDGFTVAQPEWRAAGGQAAGASAVPVPQPRPDWLSG